MRKVVDSNCLQTQELKAYLAKSERNHVVLTDYSAMEAYKGNTLASIYKSMQIVSGYPRQVIVLKGTQKVCGLSGRAAGLQRRLIDERQTRQFGEFCRQLMAAQQGDPTYQKELLEKGREATAHMNRLLSDAGEMAAHFEKLTKTFTATELRTLRTEDRLSKTMAHKLLTNIMGTAAFMFRDHPRVKKLPLSKEWHNTFLFRSALCIHLWALRWISFGGANRAKLETIRNDMIDINFATYATFFDGLLTRDRKLATLHKDAVSLLRPLTQRR